MLPVKGLVQSSSFRAQVAEKTRKEKKKIETRTKKEEEIVTKKKVETKNGKMTVRIARKYRLL